MNRKDAIKINNLIVGFLNLSAEDTATRRKIRVKVYKPFVDFLNINKDDMDDIEAENAPVDGEGRFVYDKQLSTSGNKVHAESRESKRAIKAATKKLLDSSSGIDVDKLVKVDWMKFTAKEKEIMNIYDPENHKLLHYIIDNLPPYTEVEAEAEKYPQADAAAPLNGTDKDKTTLKT